MISSGWGKMIGWGVGQKGFQQTINVTQKLTKAQVQQWAKQGLPKEWVQKQLAVYKDAIVKGGQKLNNTQLEARKNLMEKILELWD